MKVNQLMKNFCFLILINDERNKKKTVKMKSMKDNLIWIKISKQFNIFP